MSFYAILFDLNKELQTTKNLEGEINYRLLKAQVSQQCLKTLDKKYQVLYSFYQRLLYEQGEI